MPQTKAHFRYWDSCWSIEDNRLVVVDQDTVFQMKPDSLGQNHFLQVASLPNQIVYVVTVGHTSDVLDDDRSVIENRSDVVCGGADQFDPATKSLVIGSSAGKGRQEGMVDIDHRTTDPIEEVLRKNLHVTGQNNKVHLE